MRKKILLIFRFTLIFVMSLMLLTSCGEDVCDHVDDNDDMYCDECGMPCIDDESILGVLTCAHADDNSLCDKCEESYTDGKDIPDAPLCQHRDLDDNSLCDKCE